MPKLVTWMNNQRVGELTKLANGAHTFKYAPEWLASRYARPLSLSLPLQRGNITSDAVFNFFDNLLPDSPIVRDRIVKRYHAKSRQPFDLFRLAAVIDSRHFTTSFQHFRYWVAQEYTSAISNWQWGLTHPKAKKRQSIKFIRDIFWRQQSC